MIVQLLLKAQLVMEEQVLINLKYKHVVYLFIVVYLNLLFTTITF